MDEEEIEQLKEIVKENNEILHFLLDLKENDRQKTAERLQNVLDSDLKSLNDRSNGYH